ncbi:MAG TPA: FAD-binding oxidoreductase [Alphaproteobacteria bacterium]|nr:FAD-binding oxidoreductase [Alphaproteobacteria bacterium]
MANVAERLGAELGRSGLVLSEPAEVAAYTTDWTRQYSGAAPCVLRPHDTGEVAACVRACRELGLALVPQGGNTGLVGGSVPRAGEVVLSLTRLNAIEAFDAASATIQVQAGVVLQALHEDLAAHGHVFPVDLGARGSCQIGGMIATNAGGIKVLRYGHMREQVLGLEVVLADGTVLSNLNSLKKNNTGLDLKHVFIGSEGMLGIITRAVLQARPAPHAVQTALLALDTRDRLPELLTLLRERLRGLSSLEIITRDSIAFYKEQEPSARAPFDKPYPACVIVEEETGAGGNERDAFVERLSGVIEAGLAADAVIAGSDAQAQAIWRLRDGVTEAISRAGLTHKFDVTVPPGALPGFLDEMERLGEAAGDLRTLLFGHLGDGNVHVNMVQKPELAEAAFYAKGPALAESIYGRVAELKGSISAEHGIGIAKRAYLHHSRTAEEIALMRGLKRLLDPDGILNPGVLFESD